MNIKKRITAIEKALEACKDEALGIVCSYQDDTPEIREAMLKEARERTSKRSNVLGVPDIIDLEIMAKRSDYERVFPPKSVESDKQ